MNFTYLLQFISLDFWSIIWTIFTWFATLFTCYLLLYLPVCHFIYLFATLFTWFHFSISFSFSTWIYHGFGSFCGSNCCWSNKCWTKFRTNRADFLVIAGNKFNQTSRNYVFSFVKSTLLTSDDIQTSGRALSLYSVILGQ